MKSIEEIKKEIEFSQELLEEAIEEKKRKLEKGNYNDKELDIQIAQFRRTVNTLNWVLND